MPEFNPDYAKWRENALIFRVTARKLADKDMGARRELVALAADDPAFDSLVFGVTFEPRDRPVRPKGWHPMVPYAYQVRLFRWIQEVMSIQMGTADGDMGRGDGILEKARGMAGTTTFGAYAGHQWLYDSGFVATFMSHKNDIVEKTGETGTIFHKIEGYIGLDPRVDEYVVVKLDGVTEGVPCRRPTWMIPEGFNPKEHDNLLALAHPYKTNVITGTSTTKKAGTGSRTTMWVIDEMSKFSQARSVWENVSAVTDHRFGLSSPDRRFGTAFEQLARASEYACQHDGKGPSFMQLRIEENPEHDEEWERSVRARHVAVPGAAEAYDREYGLSYDAGSGTNIYPAAKRIDPKPLVFQPSVEQADFTIDPATSRDECAFHVVKYTPHLDRYGLLLSYANSGKGADFYASLVIGVPNPHYDYGEDEERVMEWFRDYGPRIRSYVGDPAGKQKLSGRDNQLHSWYGDFAEATSVLTDGHRIIQIYSSDKPEFKNLQPRWAALRWMLEKLDINDAPDTEMTLNALRQYHLKVADPDREVTSLPQEPVRSWGRDRVTALEYYAAFRRMFQNVETTGIQKATRQSRSGGVYQRTQHG